MVARPQLDITDRQSVSGPAGDRIGAAGMAAVWFTHQLEKAGRAGALVRRPGHGNRCAG